MSNRVKICFSTLLILLFANKLSFAQKDSTALEEDFSQFSGEVEELSEASTYCTSKILNGTPTKLVSIGYDFIGATELRPSQGYSNTDISYISGLRLAGNIPLISKSKITLNLGLNYSQTNFKLENSNSLGNEEKNLNKYLSQWNQGGANISLFKPLNNKNFLLFNTTHELNSNLRNSFSNELKNTKHGATIAYGWKKHDRSLFALGISRTYRGGESIIVPILLYNYTAPSKAWGVEMLLPARAHYRRNFNSRNILLLGYELEGNSYSIYNSDKTLTNSNNSEWRRSEIRLRMIYEFAVYKFIWTSLQVGYCHFYKFNVDERDKIRNIGSDIPYILENKLSGTPYVQISINLVSP